MNTNNDFNPDDFEPIPEELLANHEEQLIEYAEEEKVVSVTTDFLNIDGAEFGAQVFNALKEGHLDPMKTLLMIKKMSHLHDYFLGSDKARTNKEAKEFLRQEVTNIIGKETYRAYGAQVSIQGIGGSTTMDYSECGDLYLNRLYELTAQLKEMVKERENYIKTQLPAESRTLGVRSIKEEYYSLPVIRDEDLNEKTTANVIPPVKYSREGIVVRFVKKR